MKSWKDEIWNQKCPLGVWLPGQCMNIYEDRRKETDRGVRRCVMEIFEYRYCTLYDRYSQEFQTAVSNGSALCIPLSTR